MGICFGLDKEKLGQKQARNLSENEKQQIGCCFDSSPSNYLCKQKKLKKQLVSHLLKKTPLNLGRRGGGVPLYYVNKTETKSQTLELGLWLKGRTLASQV